MALQIFLNATLTRYVPDYDRHTGFALEIPSGTTVGQVLSTLNIPATEVALLMVNGINQGLEFALQGQERLGFFPPIGGG